METTVKETVSLSDQEWNIAHAIAQDLVSAATDPNEVKKALEYLRKFNTKSDLGKSFFQYLTTLAKNGDRVGHSSKTVEYYRSLEKACKKHLADYQDQPQLMLKILGWTTRLMRYYKTTPQGEWEISHEPKQSERQAEIENASSAQEFSEGQEIEATVAELLKKGNKVTYEIAATTQRFTEKEPKKYKSLSEGQKVKLRILRLEDGKIKKVKCVDP
jgi:hypothetical protein